uniref:Ig-like domain-containing protein n=1 Tax=Pyxicephalus adspersus TaxID=30357 RepID=A0AAV3AIC9_PYXAD|nr:TPA: hypothetical protein GDO54_013656 [Pyxicephalus adspersus]
MFVSLPCEYNVGNFRSLKWFKQYPGDKLNELMTVALDGNRTEGRLTVELQDRRSKRSVLHIEKPSVSDSALYQCAVEAQSTGREFNIASRTETSSIKQRECSWSHTGGYTLANSILPPVLDLKGLLLIQNKVTMYY